MKERGEERKWRKLVKEVRMGREWRERKLPESSDCLIRLPVLAGRTHSPTTTKSHETSNRSTVSSLKGAHPQYLS